MKKKHRDITVDGVKYAWMVKGYDTVRIFKTKNDFVDFTIENDRTVTPKMVAALIIDPVDALQWINANPCPFCGALVEPVTDNDNLQDEFFICSHDEDCWFAQTSDERTWIEKIQIKFWNTRRR